MSPTLVRVEWEHLFDDLEGQLAAEWEAERAALTAESERLRISKLSLRDRLRALSSAAVRIRVEVRSGERRVGKLRATGADWAGLSAEDDPRLIIVPLGAITVIDADHGAVLKALEPASGGEGLRERMTFGFVLRDLARRRTPVTISIKGRDPQHGTIDRAGADHLDLALHDQGEPRRPRAVRGFLIVAFESVSWVRVEEAAVEY